MHDLPEVSGDAIHRLKCSAITDRFKRNAATGREAGQQRKTAPSHWVLRVERPQMT